MSASILRHCIDTYNDPLTYLINLSINQGILIPMYKSDDKPLKQNYSPISGLSFSLKRLRNLSKIIWCNNILYDNQFGFRMNYSTSHAMITLVKRECQKHFILQKY